MTTITPASVAEQEVSSVYDLMAHRSREQIIDAWMEDKLFYQGQIKRLTGIVRELHSLHVAAGDLFQSARQDVVLDLDADLRDWTGSLPFHLSQE